MVDIQFQKKSKDFDQDLIAVKLHFWSKYTILLWNSISHDDFWSKIDHFDSNLIEFQLVSIAENVIFDHWNTLTILGSILRVKNGQFRTKIYIMKSFWVKNEHILISPEQSPCHFWPEIRQSQPVSIDEKWHFRSELTFWAIESRWNSLFHKVRENGWFRTENSY